MYLDSLEAAAAAVADCCEQGLVFAVKIEIRLGGVKSAVAWCVSTLVRIPPREMERAAKTKPLMLIIKLIKVQLILISLGYRKETSVRR